MKPLTFLFFYLPRYLNFSPHLFRYTSCFRKMSRVNLDEPRWDQSTYEGRARHFFTTTNPMNLLCTPAQLENARDIVTRYRYCMLS